MISECVQATASADTGRPGLSTLTHRNADPITLRALCWAQRFREDKDVAVAELVRLADGNREVLARALQSVYVGSVEGPVTGRGDVAAELLHAAITSCEIRKPLLHSVSQP